MILSDKYRSFKQLPAGVRWRIPVTWLLLGVSRFFILLLPFRYVAVFLGQRAEAPVVPLVPAEHIAQLRQLKQLIAVTSKYCPWRANCFAQAMTARLWLNWWGLPYSVFFGVARDGATALKAHAWVVVGPVAVSGGNSFSQFTVVASYVSKTWLSACCRESDS